MHTNISVLSTSPIIYAYMFITYVLYVIRILVQPSCLSQIIVTSVFEHFGNQTYQYAKNVKHLNIASLKVGVVKCKYCSP